MILNQKNEFHWQAVFVTKLESDTAFQTGLLYMILTSQFPKIQSSEQAKLDLTLLREVDILGSCLLSENRKLVSILKHHCMDVLMTNTVPIGWESVIQTFKHTSAFSFYANVQSVSLSTQNRMIMK